MNDTQKPIFMEAVRNKINKLHQEFTETCSELLQGTDYKVSITVGLAMLSYAELETQNNAASVA